MEYTPEIVEQVMCNGHDQTMPYMSDDATPIEWDFYWGGAEPFGNGSMLSCFITDSSLDCMTDMTQTNFTNTVEEGAGELFL